jgi:hypothetical protein
MTAAIASMSGMLLTRLSANSLISSMSKVLLPDPVEVSFSRASRTRLFILRRWDAAGGDGGGAGKGSLMAATWALSSLI